MHAALAQAILKTFDDRTGDEHRAVLASFSLRAWNSSLFWLDTSGLALYFMNRLCELNLESSIPIAVRERLEQNFADNRERNLAMGNEAMRLHFAFTEHSIEYVSVKGLSLVPHACKDAALRLQLDLDILARPADAMRCKAVLESLGYLLAGTHKNTWEFKTKTSQLPSIRDLYKVKQQRSIEVHFRYGADIMVVQNAQGLPVLPDVSAFLMQAEHMLKHLRSEFTRLSWLLEFRNSVKYWGDTPNFWVRLRNAAAYDRELCAAIGASVVLAELVFGEFAPPDLKTWAVDTLDRTMRLWLELYGCQAVMAEFPGSKLYLLMSKSTTASEKRLRLLPAHVPPMVVPVTPDAGKVGQMRRLFMQARYIGLRARFHVRSGWRYGREAPRWRRSLAELHYMNKPTQESVSTWKS